MYDIAAHKSRHVVNATVADLSHWVGLDHRVVRSCLKDLERNHDSTGEGFNQPQ